MEKEYVKGGMKITYDVSPDPDEPGQSFIPYGMLDDDEKKEYLKLKEEGKLK